MKGKINYKSKFLIILIVICVIIGIVFLMNPFYWLMQSKYPKQPELSTKEKYLFEELNKKYNTNLDIERYYTNYTPRGEDTLYKEKYDKVLFDYFVSITNIDTVRYIKFTKEDVSNIALNVKNNILKENKNLKEIQISIKNRLGKNGYEAGKIYYFNYNIKKDSLELKSN